MQTFPFTGIAFILDLFFAFFFAQMAESSKQARNRSMLCYLSFMIIVLFCSLRFFAGNDYYEYFSNFQSISKYNLSFLEQ
jgi:hypothetical protein